MSGDYSQANVDRLVLGQEVIETASGLVANPTIDSLARLIFATEEFRTAVMGIDNYSVVSMAVAKIASETLSIQQVVDDHLA